MDEIDNIIIDSLRNLKCEIDETTTHLRQFDPNMVLAAISTCLEAIIPNSKFPKKQPPLMSIKLKMATDLAEQIKQLGFRGDIGYQTILYCNEVEIRRVLMFLVERLPKETNKMAHIEPTSYVTNLVAKIQDSLNMFWLPSCAVNNGCRKTAESYIVSSTGDSCALITKKLKIADSSNKYSEHEKQFWIHNVPEITKQCTPKSLIPSLLFNDFAIKFDDNQFACIFQLKSQAVKEIEHPHEIMSLDITLKTDSDQSETVQDHFQVLVQNLQAKKHDYMALQDSLQNNEMQLSQANSMICEEDKVLQDTLSKINLKSKTLSVISKEENFLKLKKLVENSHTKLVHLANQWNQVQSPLLEEYKSLQNTLNTQDSKFQQDQAKTKKLTVLCHTLTADLNDKKQSEDRLKQKLEHSNKNSNRSSYTRRIFEIIANIKKQDKEIQKILKDTKEVQKEISTLTGQVDRSFTLSDEIIFRDAKIDETARKAYIMLVVLHEECGNIIKALTDLGLVERECRNLQEQIDSETVKEVAAKLENVNKDLAEIRKETEILLSQRKL